MDVQTMEDAFRKAIKKYWKDKDFETAKSFKDKKYNKKYFDSMEKEFLGEQVSKKVTEEDY